MAMKRKSGFTFIEALVILIVLGVVIAITGPKFRTMLYQSREGRTKSHLGDLRGAVAIYYSDNFGLYPSDAGAPETRLKSTLVPHYIKQIPFVELTHLHSKKLNTVQDKLGDGGDWVYSTYKGFVAVNCSHSDTKSEVISNW